MMFALALLVSVMQSPEATAQTDSTTYTTPAPVLKSVPFGAGERMEYVAKIGFQHVGRGSMALPGIEDARGRPAVQPPFQLKARALCFSANCVLEGGLDQATC